MFAYCRNNPVCRIDITGTADQDCVDADEDALDDEELTGQNGGLAPSQTGGVQGGLSNGSSNSGGYGGGGSGGFRKGLQNLTGESGAGKDAHHIFPQHYSSEFDSIGINNQNPAYGSWWDSSAHRKASYEYNQWWYYFFKEDGVTAEDAFALVEFLSGLFGFALNY